MVLCILHAQVYCVTLMTVHDGCVGGSTAAKDAARDLWIEVRMTVMVVFPSLAQMVE